MPKEMNGAPTVLKVLMAFSVRKYIMGLCDELFDNVNLKVGNERKVKMWTHWWLDNIPVKQQFPDLLLRFVYEGTTAAMLLLLEMGPSFEKELI